MSFLRSNDFLNHDVAFRKQRPLITELNTLPPYRKVLILSILCTTYFVDSINASTLVTAIPIISEELHISINESPWLYAAYQLTFASLLLIAGRLTDLYNPRYIFLIGSTSLAVFSLVGGFIRAEIPLFIFRGLMGASAALTVPSAQSLTIYLFVDPVSQAKALGTFGAMAGFGAVSGLLIGALYVEFVTWHWVFFFSAIVSGFVSIGFLLLVPNVQRFETEETRMERILRFKRIDLFGVSIVTVAQTLFILSMTSAASRGWGSAQVIAPLVLSVVLFIGFFVWEAYVPEDIAAIPPKTWKYRNVTVFIFTAMVPAMWWGTIYPLFSWYWQFFLDWSPVKVSLHALPVAVGSLPSIALATALVPKIGPKLVVTIGFIVLIVGSTLLPFDNSPGRYWSFGFIGFLTGTFGSSLIYMTSNIALFANTPPAMSGVVSSLFLGSIKTAAAAGLAVATSIQTSIQNHQKGPVTFKGTEAGLWFLTGVFVVAAVLFLIFARTGITKATIMASEINLVEGKYSTVSTNPEVQTPVAENVTYHEGT